MVSMLLLTKMLSVPVDRGANVPGSSLAPAVICDSLRKNGVHLDHVSVSTSRFHRETLANTYMQTFRTLDASNEAVVIAGGDHSISIATVAAANDHCISMNEHLGIIWCDAHADFNTPLTTRTGNLHGMPVAVLCKHALPFISFGNEIQTHQFAYWGVRDVDELEQQRMEEHDMLILDASSDASVAEWAKRFDRIHVSFDVDVIDPRYAPGVSTPVPDGPDPERIQSMFRTLKQTGKIKSIDIVELNPVCDRDGRTAELSSYLLSQLL